jgi:hypothetical protein
MEAILTPKQPNSDVTGGYLRLTPRSGSANLRHQVEGRLVKLVTAERVREIEDDRAAPI